MKTNKEDLLSKLEIIQPGLATKDMIQQANSFLFYKNRVATYNDEMFCSMDCNIGFKGAVQAVPLLGILRKFQEEIIDVEANGSNLVVQGKRKKTAKIRSESKIYFRLNKIEQPEEWYPLPEEFSDAINLVQSCASKDTNYYNLTCIHITPKWIEAFDNVQVARHKIKMEMEHPVLVSRDSLKHITTMGPTEFGVTPSWLHFRNSVGLWAGFRCTQAEYPNTTPVLKLHGEKLVFPKGLREAVERAEIFSAESTDDNLVEVRLQPGRMDIKGKGSAGSYHEPLKADYDGPKIGFLTTPKLLSEVCSQHNECEVEDDKMIVRGTGWAYVTSLFKKTKGSKDDAE